MHPDLGRVVVDEVPNPVEWDEPEFGPFPEGSNGRLFAGWENAADAKANDIGELTSGARGWYR